MNRRWLVNRTNPEYIGYLSKIASVSPVFAQILINRGIKTPEEISYFLDPHISKLSDPFDLPGMRAVVDRIITASKNGERVLVHGDYDADGLTATAIMVHTLRMLGLDVHYFIPNRITHGYGFNSLSVKIAEELGVTLIITVDCGITSFETVSYAKREGIDVIITDHHEPAISSQQSAVSGQTEDYRLTTNDYLLPDAFAIVNPKLSKNSSLVTRHSSISGAGVAFKIAQALDSSLVTCHSSLLLDLAAIGTIADVVPLTGENRIIVREGLKLIENGTRLGLKALKKVSGIDERRLKSGLLSFTLIPRINAPGRVSDSNDVVRLLLTDSEDEAINIALWLDKLNSERQQIEEGVYQDALSKLNEKDFGSAIVLSSEGWHKGVIGIVASRIAEVFYRPTFIFSIKDGIAKGSARSIPPFDIYKGLISCSELLIGFGGHKQAAGLELKAADISSFEKKFDRIVKETLTDGDLTPLLEIDADANLSDINFNLARELEMLEPLGFGNPEPLLGSKRLEVIHPRIVGNNHLKMKLRQGGYYIDTIGFDMGEELLALSSQLSAMIDVVFTPSINEWEGGRCLQLNLKAFRPSL
ncbi:MAG: single-stranded-DNA-specific exonuclease RecJ [Nitrospirota bacterium]